MLYEPDKGPRPRVMHARCEHSYYAAMPIKLSNKTLAINDYAQWQFIVVDPVSGRQLYKWPSSTAVRVSPDGQYIAFVGGDRGVNLFLWEIDSSQARLLTNLRGYDYSGNDIWWTPDGKRVLFDVGSSKTQRCALAGDDPGAGCFDVYELDIPSGAVRFVGRNVHYLD
jgi:Tol biopolymer transport system component